jgi:hypothetical protein
MAMPLQWQNERWLNSELMIIASQKRRFKPEKTENGTRKPKQAAIRH